MCRYGLWMIGIGVILWALSAAAPPALATLPPGWCPTGSTEDDPPAPCRDKGTCDNRVVRNQWIPGPGTSPMTIRVKFNVFCDDDGLDCAASLSDVTAQRDTLNNLFGNYGIQFAPAAPDPALVQFINDSRFRHFCEGLVPDACRQRSGTCRSSIFTEEYIMKSQYADNPAYQLNIYVTDTSNAGFTGLGYLPWCTDAAGTYGGVILNGGHVGGFSCGPTGNSLCRALVHEIGHNLGLWHTFHGVSELSCISGCREGPECNGLDPQTGLCPVQDCDDVGDFCWDTPHQ